MKKIKGFTLAEVMIVLTVIGIISAIIYPIASQSAPKKEIMLFKKGHNTLYQVISTLVNSDRYYKDGDLGIKADNTNVDDTNDENKKYLCNTFADVLSTKKVNCSTYTNYAISFAPYPGNYIIDENTTVDFDESLDYFCKISASSVGEEIVTSDGIVYYQSSPGIPFGLQYMYTTRYPDAQRYDHGERTCGVNRLFMLRHAGGICEGYTTKQLYVHKTFCMDIDGIGKGEDPFGYGIRTDGKILNGKRATEWLDKGLSDD